MESVPDGWTVHLRRGEILSDELAVLRFRQERWASSASPTAAPLRFIGVETIEGRRRAGAGGNAAKHGAGHHRLLASSVYENATNGTVVGTVAAADPDTGDTLTYALLDDAEDASRSIPPPARSR